MQHLRVKSVVGLLHKSVVVQLPTKRGGSTGRIINHTWFMWPCSASPSFPEDVLFPQEHTDGQITALNSQPLSLGLLVSPATSKAILEKAAKQKEIYSQFKITNYRANRKVQPALKKTAKRTYAGERSLIFYLWILYLPLLFPAISFFVD